MHWMHRCAGVSCQLAQHGDHHLHGHVAVLVDLVRTDQRVHDHDTDAELLDLRGHVLKQRIVLCHAVPCLGRQGDADVILSIHEQPAGQIFVLYIVVLHDGREA